MSGIQNALPLTGLKADDALLTNRQNRKTRRRQTEILHRFLVGCLLDASFTDRNPAGLQQAATLLTGSTSHGGVEHYGSLANQCCKF